MLRMMRVKWGRHRGHRPKIWSCEHLAKKDKKTDCMDRIASGCRDSLDRNEKNYVVELSGIEPLTS